MFTIQRHIKCHLIIHWVLNNLSLKRLPPLLRNWLSQTLELFISLQVVSGVIALTFEGIASLRISKVLRAMLIHLGLDIAQEEQITGSKIWWSSWPPKIATKKNYIMSGKHFPHHS